MSDEVSELASKPLRYFPHDADASGDPKCKRLMRRFGVAGYGMWWLLCEALASEQGHGIPVETDNDAENLAAILDSGSADEAVEFARFLEAVGLVEISDGVLRSRRMDENAEAFGRRRVAGRKGGKHSSSKA